MAVIGVKSITGITSITNAAGGADVLTFHSNNTTERLRISSVGELTSTAAQANVATFTSNQSASTIYVKDTDGDGILISGSSAYGHRIYTNTTEDLILGTNTAEDLRIKSGGNIGIGTGIPAFAAINSVSAGAVRGIEIFKNGTDTGTAIKLAGRPGGASQYHYAQLGFSGANFTSHWATYNTSGTKIGEIVIGATGKIGIGVNNPDCLLHVQGTEISGYGAHANTKLCVEHDGNTAIEIVSSANYLGGIYFSDSGADGVGKIEYYHGTAGDNMRFNTNGSEKLRIDSSGNVAIGYTVAYHNYASGATGTSTRLAAVHTTGTGWKEMAHFAAGTDSDNTGSVVRLSHYGNDRGAYLKAGRGDSDRAIAYFGLRNSSNTDTDLLTFRQDSGEYRTITNSEFRFNTPTNAERAIVAYGNHSTSYSLGSSGGAAIRFKNTSGDHSIEFDTHWSGTHHSTAMTLGKSGSIIVRSHRDASVGRDYTTGTLTDGQSVSWNGSGTTLTNSGLNLNSVGGNGGAWIGALSVAASDGNPSGSAIIMGSHGQGFNVYNRLLSSFDSGITVTWASGNWNYSIANSSGDTVYYRFTVIHMGTRNTTVNGR